jgi:hypothetical protein
MKRDSKTQREKVFLSLPREERETIISHGTAIRLSNLKKQLFLAESKLRHYEEKYKVTMVQMDAEGLPDNADCEIHEDYIMWHHWADVSDKVKKDIASLDKIAQTCGSPNNGLTKRSSATITIGLLPPTN